MYVRKMAMLEDTTYNMAYLMPSYWVKVYRMVGLLGGGEYQRVRWEKWGESTCSLKRATEVSQQISASSARELPLTCKHLLTEMGDRSQPTSISEHRAWESRLGTDMQAFAR